MKIYKALAKNKGAVKASAQLVRDDNYGLEFKDDDGATLRVVDDNGEYYIRRIYNDGTGFAWDKSRERFSSPEEAKRAILDGAVTFRLKASRSIKAARTLEIYTYDELEPTQKEYVQNNWSKMKKLSDSLYEIFNEDLMFGYTDEIVWIADEYVSKYGLDINTEKIYWQENSQGPYPEWNLSDVFGYYGFDGSDGRYIEVEFYGRGLEVQSGVTIDGYDDYDSLSDSDKKKVDEITDHAQEFIDTIWKYIRQICMSYPDDDWVASTLEGNPDAFEFIITSDGEVRAY